MSSYDKNRPIQISYNSVVAGIEIHHLCNLSIKEGEILKRLMNAHPEMVDNQMGKLIAQAAKLAEQEEKNTLPTE